MRWERTLPYRGVPPSSGIQAHAVGACVPSPVPYSYWLGGFPPPGWACLLLGAHVAVQWGPPLRPGSAHAPWVRAVRPPPLMPMHGLCTRLGRGFPVFVLVPVCRGGPGVVCSGLPPRAPAARLWRTLLGGGFPSPVPPSTSACVRRGLPFGGGTRRRLSCVVPPRSKRALGSPFRF